MRTLIHFDVVGADRNQLEEKAIVAFRELMGDPAAELPSSATIEVEPEHTEQTGDGTVVARTWRGTVNVTLTADGNTR